MILFILFAVLLIGVATTLLLLPFFKNPPVQPQVTQSTVNLRLLQEQLNQLEMDAQAGHLSAQEFALQKEELEKRTLDEVVLAQGQKDSSVPQIDKKLPLFLAIFIPFAVVGLYFIIGNPVAIDPPEKTQQRQIQDMVVQLESQVKKDPNNARTWEFLGKTYAALNRIDDAINAYKKSLSLDKNNSATYVDLADLLAFKNKSIQQDALDLINEALRLDPKQPQALALKGTAAYEKQNFKEAIKYWELAIQNLDPKDEIFIANLKAAVQETQNQLGDTGKKPVNTSLSIAGKVSISPKVSGQVRPTDTIFIYAKAMEGPKMPLAIIKSTADKLPMSFQLSDEQSMAPQFKLSQFKEVTLTARISKTGNAIPEKGDLIGVINRVQLGETNVQLVIQDIQP